MSKIRPVKVAAIDEVKARVDETTTALVTEYRGLTVAEISSVRRQLRTLGADYKVFKNTLVRRAISGTTVEPMTEFLEGPTAIAFVKGDVSAVAKALRDIAKSSPNLVVKGGVLDGKALSPSDVAALADLPSREVLLSMFAGALAAPMRTLAGLMKAVPQNLAYGLAALLEQKGGAPVAPASNDDEADVEVAPRAAADETDAGAEAPADETDAGAAAPAEATPEASEDVASEPAE